MILAGAISVYLILLVSPQKVVDSIARARLDWFLPASIAFVVASFYLDSAGLWVLFSRTVMRTPLREVLIVRAVTQFMGAVNLWLGQMGMAYYYSRRSNLPMTYLVGTFLLLFVVDLTDMFLFAGAVIGPTGTKFDTAFMISVAAGLMLLPLLLLGRRASEKRLGDLKEASLWYTKTGLRQLFAPTFLIPTADLLLLVFARVFRYPLRAFYVVIAMWSFHVDVPLGAGLVVACFTLLLGSIPLTPQGVGILQAAGLFFFESFGAPHDVLAALFAVSAATMAGHFLFGLYYLKGGLELMRTPPPAEPAG